MGLKQIIAKPTPTAAALPQPVVQRRFPGEPPPKSKRPGLPVAQAPTISQQVCDVTAFLASLSGSLASMPAEMAYRHCCSAFDNNFFNCERNSDFKSELVSFLNERFPGRNELWAALKNRSTSVLHLL